MIAWLDEHGYAGDERATAIEIMRTLDVTWRNKKIQEIEDAKPCRA